MPGTEIAPGIVVGKGTRIAGSAVLVPPVLLGDDVLVGPGAHMERVVVADGSVVPPGTVLHDALVTAAIAEDAA